MYDSFKKLPEQKQKHIVSICMSIFIKNGYALANTVEMAKACGIAKGSLFHYFGSKKHLFLYIVKHCIEEVMSHTQSALSMINDETYFERVRQSVEIKMALRVKYPQETALLARAFSERGHEASEELQAMARDYAAQLRSLNKQYIGDIEQALVREGVDLRDANTFVQTVMAGVTTRLLQEYAQNPEELLRNPGIVSGELEKVISFILNGIGK